MLEIYYAPTFIRLYKDLDLALKEEVKDKIQLFTNTKNHIHLKVHKLKGIDNTYSFSVNYKIRIVFEYQDKKTVNLLYIGSHDVVYGK